MTGKMHVVVGPSGSGKDTLMDGAKALLPESIFVKRTITRAANAGGESINSVNQERFDQLVTEGRFCVYWHANDLSYGIPNEICEQYQAGHHVVFNGSRKALNNIRERLPDIEVIWITVSREALATRLRARGRETEADIAKRLQRQCSEPPQNVTIISNNSTVEEGVQALTEALSGKRVPLDEIKATLLTFTTEAEI